MRHSVLQENCQDRSSDSWIFSGNYFMSPLPFHLLLSRYKGKNKGPKRTRGLKWEFGKMDGKESACSAGDLGSILGLGRSPGEGTGYPLQYSGLENSMNCIAHGVAKNQTQLRDFHFSHLKIMYLPLLQKLFCNMVKAQICISL